MILVAEQPDDARQRLSLHVVHHQEHAAGVRVYLRDGNDIGVTDTRGEPRLLEQV